MAQTHPECLMFLVQRRNVQICLISPQLGTHFGHFRDATLRVIEVTYVWRIEEPRHWKDGTEKLLRQSHFPCHSAMHITQT